MKTFMAGLMFALCGHVIATTKPFINKEYVTEMGIRAEVIHMAPCVYRKERLVCLTTRYEGIQYLAFGIPEDGFFRIRYLVEILDMKTGESVEVYRFDDKEM